MITPPASSPLVLCLSGHDPVGGAGLQADIEAVAAQGAHAVGVITALTVQDTHNVRRVSAVAPALLAEQLACVLDDCDIAAIKLGLLGDIAQVVAICETVDRCRVPLVIDPVLRAGGGANLATTATAQALLEVLIPRATVITPNAAEARRLAPGLDTLDACAGALLARGCAHVLITGGDEATATADNVWYSHAAAPVRYVWPRLPGPFHGAGCTLASALAARLALGEAIDAALLTAQTYVHDCLDHAQRVGRGRLIPRRLQPPAIPGESPNR
jgi:hydroxymethylpyrimidine/phosphomethylpyrimidine kinase